MEQNNALKHLSEEEIKEVIRMYYDTSIKLVNIIDKFNIKVKPANFAKILPPVKCEDTCIFCGSNLMHKIPCRNDSIRGDDVADKYCPKCGHHEYKHGKKSCDCDGCRKLIEQELEQKKKLVRETYSMERESIKVEELSLDDQIKLVYVLIKNPLHNISQIAPIVRYTDDVDIKMYIEYLGRLVKINAISVSPDSDIEAFSENDFPNVFWIDRVIYDVNIEFHDDFVHEVNNYSYFAKHFDAGLLLEYYKELLYNDLIEKFQWMLEKRKLKLNIPYDADKQFKELLDKISYTQILELCRKVSVFLSDKVLTGEMPNYKANNMALKQVSKFYERSVHSGWELRKAEINDVSPEIDYYICVVLCNDLDFLHKTVSLDNLKWYRKPIEESDKK